MDKTVPTKQSYFVGREAELKILEENLFLAVREKRPRFIFIEGEGGVGKSTLVEQFLRIVADQYPEWMIGQWMCTMDLQDFTLVPFKQILQQLTRQGIRLKIIRGNLGKFARNVALDWAQVVVDSVIPFKAGAAVKTTVEELEKVGRLPENLKPENIYSQYLSLLKRYTENHPAILYLDALESADESSLRLLFHLIGQLTDRPILVLASYRSPDMRTTSRYHEVFCDLYANIAAVRKPYLTEIQMQADLRVADYLNKRYPQNTFPPDFAKFIQELTEGLPLFVSQLFLFLESEEMIQFTAEEPRSAFLSCSTDEIKPDIPKTLEDLLKYRIDKLTDHLCELIKGASVEGEKFTVEVIAALNDLSNKQAASEIASLDFLYKLVHPSPNDDNRFKTYNIYRFVHVFIRDYIYKKRLSEAERHILHAEIAKCLEELYKDNLSSVAEQLSMHFKLAGDFDKAARYAYLAATKRSSPLVWTAVGHWAEEGLNLVANLPRSKENDHLKFNLLSQAGFCYNAGGGGGQEDKAIEKFEAALSLAREMKIENEDVGTIYVRLADVYELMEDYPAYEQAIRDGLEMFRRIGMPLCSARLELEALEAFRQLRNAGENAAKAKWEQILAEGKKLPAGEQSERFERFAARIVYWNAIALANQGRYTEAFQAYQDSIRRAEAAGSIELTLVPLLNMADEHLKIHEVNESEKLAEKALPLAMRMGDRDNEAYALAVQGGCHLERGETSQAIEKFNQSIALCEKIKSYWNMPYTYAELAYAYSLESKFEAADEAGQEASRHALLGDDRYAQGYVLFRLAQIESARGSDPLAEGHYKKAEALFKENGYSHFLARAQFHHAQLLVKKSKLEQAKRLLLEASDILNKLGIKSDIDAVQKLLDEIRKLLGEM